MPFSTTTHPTPTTPLRHAADHLTKQIAMWRTYLGHEDKAVRLVALRAIAEYVDALIAEEYAERAAKTTAQQRPERLVRRIRRFFHALPYVD